MGSNKTPLVHRLLLLACALAAIAVPGVFAASAIAEESTTTPTEPSAGSEPVTESVAPPAKETVETVTAPKKEATVPAEPTTSPQTTTGSESSAASGGGSSGSSSSAATAPVKISAGPTQSSTPKTQGGGSGSGAVHHASDLAGASGGSTGTSPSTAGGGGHGASEVLGIAATSEPEASKAAEPTERGASVGLSGRRGQGPVATHEDARPHVATQLGDARAVEVAPKPAPSSSPLTTVGHVLSRPFSEPTSSSAILIDLAILLGIGAMGVAVWLEMGGGLDRQRLVDLLDMARRGRNAD